MRHHRRASEEWGEEKYVFHEAAMEIISFKDLTEQNVNLC